MTTPATDRLHAAAQQALDSLAGLGDVLTEGEHATITYALRQVLGTPTTAPAPASAPAAPADRATDRRDRYAAAIHRVDRVPGPGYPGWKEIMELFPDDLAAYREMAGAAMVVADTEQAELRAALDATFLHKKNAETETAPWPSTTQYAVEICEVDDWVGVTYHRPTLAEAQERRDAYRRRFPDARFRIVRWGETATVAEIDPEPATAATEEPQP